MKNQKMKPLKYQLTVESFEEGWVKLKDTLVEVNNLFADTENTIESVTKRMIELFTVHIPSISKGKGLSWSLHSQTMRTSLKAGSNISYGWNIDKVEYNSNGKPNEIKQITFTVMLYSASMKYYQEKALRDAGFTIVED